jgi:hypothetical protein
MSRKASVASREVLSSLAAFLPVEKRYHATRAVSALAMSAFCTSTPADGSWLRETKSIATTSDQPQPTRNERTIWMMSESPLIVFAMLALSEQQHSRWVSISRPSPFSSKVEMMVAK